VRAISKSERRARRYRRIATVQFARVNCTYYWLWVMRARAARLRYPVKSIRGKSTGDLMRMVFGDD
jgi:hypothetical protein